MKRVIIALPGDRFSGAFLRNWSNALLYLQNKGYTVMMVNDYSSFVPFSRMKTLGLDTLRGVNQKPFNGEVDYDVWVTIDSDVIFIPEQLEQLIEDTDKHPIVSGIYRMLDMKHYAAVKTWNANYFKKHGSFKFLRVDDLEGAPNYIKVAYNGMGFMAIKREVLEKMKYPYFHRELQVFEMDDGTVVNEMCSEDVSFCKNAKDVGYDVIVNTELKVGHMKELVI
tara:strand:- start:876 stop:1547 length:672 start_codon:yes stop_codon:yes gene_type:complete